MNALNLLMPDLTPSPYWICGECKNSWCDQNGAERCCQCSYCGTIIKFDMRNPRRYRHVECEAKLAQETMDRRISEAEKVVEWKGWVYIDGAGSKDGYFESLVDLIEWYQFENLPLPEWAFCCEESSFDGPSVDRIIDDISENGFEDIEDYLSGVDEFAKAIDLFNEANKSLLSYHPDYKRVVRVTHPEGVSP